MGRGHMAHHPPRHSRISPERPHDMSTTRPTLTVTTAPSANWSESNQPWLAGTSESIITASWPSGLLIVDLPTSGGDFATRMDAVLRAAPGPAIVRLPVGVHHLTAFRLAGRSGRQDFAFGYHHPKWLGWLGAGAGKTVVQMDADSMSGPQLALLATMTAASFNPSELSIALLQPTDQPTVYLGGLTVRAEDQQDLTAVAADLTLKGVVTPQPAPHGGISVGPNKGAVISYCRFVGASRALYAAPPFEHGAVSSQYSPGLLLDHCEIDGRQAPEINPARPRRGGLVMGNNDTLWEARDSWFHHCNVSRIAINDQNRETAGTYRFTRCKVNNVGGNQNVDPALNGGVSLGGWTNAVVAGFESVAGRVEFIDCNLSVDNANKTSNISQHLGFTSTGTRNPRGGRLRVVGGTFRNSAFPSIEGFLCIRVSPTTYWALDGPAATMDVRLTEGGPRLSPWGYSGTWPPAASQIAAAGITPQTHFIIHGLNKVAPLPVPPTGVDNTVTKPKLVGTVSVSHLKSARFADPVKVGTPVGKYGDEVYTLELALFKTQWLRWVHVDGHYGSATVGDGSLGYGGVKGFQRKHTGTTKPDGWMGTIELGKLFRLAGMNVKVAP